MESGVIENLGVRAGRQPWLWVLLVLGITSLVEAYGVSQVQAFFSFYLLELGVPRGDLSTWTGLLNSGIFLFGLPMIPLWGVWADKYSRKAVIVRSALVEAVVFTVAGLASTPNWLAASLLLMGFQLGNTGVMLAALRDVVPINRIGLSVSVFGACGPIGFAVGPVLGGILHDGVHLTYGQLYFVAAGLSLGTALLLTLGFREIRSQAIPEGRVLQLAYGIIGRVLKVGSTRRLFSVFGLGFIGNQVAFIFLPLVVLGIHGNRPDLASTVGLVLGLANLLGALISPFGGLLGDRFGFRRVLAVAILGGAMAVFLMPFAPGLPALFVLAIFFGAAISVFMAMIFSLLATETPADMRSSTLNLVFLPIYLAGIIGPLIAAVAASLSGVLVPVFIFAAICFAAAIIPLRTPYKK